jgi:uncharacterized protein (TIGR02246 family)
MTHDFFNAANQAWNDAFNRGDNAALAALYAENAVLSPGNGATIHGRDAIRQLFQGFLDNGVNGHAIEVIEAGGDDQVRYQVAKWGAFGAESNGSKPHFGGILTSVLEKTAGGQWLIRLHTWNAAA